MLNLNEIYLGDCLDLMKEIPDKKIDLILTDPPYGLGECGLKNHKRDTKPGYSKSKTGKPRTREIKSTKFTPKEWDFKRVSEDYFREMFRVSKNQIIFGGNYYTDFLPPSSGWIIWDKDNTGDFADCEMAWTSFKKSVKKYKWRWNGMLQEDMNHKEIRIHPTQKPRPLLEMILKDYSKENELILDPFLGSGASAEACINLKRNFIGIEKDFEYYSKGKERINKSKQQERLLNWF